MHGPQRSIVITIDVEPRLLFQQRRHSLIRLAPCQRTGIYWQKVIFKPRFIPLAQQFSAANSARSVPVSC